MKENHIIFHLQCCLTHFFPYKEVCIKQVWCWENDVFHVSSWWESKIFLSMCSLTSCIPLCGSVLFPAASPYCQGCSWVAAVGQWGRRGLSDISPGLQLCCRRACVSSGCLCSIWSGAGYLNCSTYVWYFAVFLILKRIPSWGDNNLKPFKLVVWPCTLWDRAGDMISGPQVLLSSLGGESHKPYLCLTQMWQESSECDCCLELSCGVPCSGSHRSFLLGACNFNVEILYLGDFLCSFKILKI